MVEEEKLRQRWGRRLKGLYRFGRGSMVGSMLRLRMVRRTLVRGLFQYEIGNICKIWFV